MNRPRLWYRPFMPRIRKQPIQLVRGFHGIEQNSWRWTMGRFVVTLRPPAGSADKGATLTLKFTLPEAVIDKVKSTTITATVQNTTVGSKRTASRASRRSPRMCLQRLLKGDAATVEFSMDKFLTAGTVDGRELGLVFVNVGSGVEVEDRYLDIA